MWCNGWNSKNLYGLWVDLESLGVDLENENHVSIAQQQERMLGSCPVESHSTLGSTAFFFNMEKERNVYLNCSHSVAKLCPTLCDPMDCSMLGFHVLHYLPEFAQTDVYWVSDAIHFILCHPLLLPPSIFPSVRIFSNELVLGIRWPKYWSFSFNISLSNEHSGLIPFRTDWFDFPAIQWTLKSLLQYPPLKSINYLVLSVLYSPTLTSIYYY